MYQKKSGTCSSYQIFMKWCLKYDGTLVIWLTPGFNSNCNVYPSEGWQIGNFITLILHPLLAWHYWALQFDPEKPCWGCDPVVDEPPEGNFPQTRQLHIIALRNICSINEIVLQLSLAEIGTQEEREEVNT